MCIRDRYLVKARGRGSFRFYQPQMNVNLLSHIKLDHAMRLAMEQGLFRLHYQPQISLENGSLVGAEALIRWTDAELGQVSPAQFIPLAEESGFIITLGTWVLEEAVRQAVLWQQRGTPVTVSVNVSALQFQQSDFVETVAAVLKAAALPAHLLELELTESILIQDAHETMNRLHALAALGVTTVSYTHLDVYKRQVLHRVGQQTKLGAAVGVVTPVSYTHLAHGHQHTGRYQCRCSR